MFALPSKAPALATFQRCLNNLTVQQKCYFYQASTFVLTFITYVIYHMNKRPFPLVKSVLSRNCSMHNNNETCQSWKPFTGSRQDKYLFGLLDFTFMITYSFSLFITGYIAERTDLRLFLACGMVMTSASTALFGMTRPMEIHSAIYFFVMQVACGVAQSTGLPAVTEVIGAWIPNNKSGLVFGVWSFHAFLGNIIGNFVSGSFLGGDWSLSFFLPAILTLLNGIIIYLMLIPDPRHVGIRTNEDATTDVELKSIEEDKHDEESDILDNIQPNPTGISFSRALQIPGVIEFSLCIFFVKLVSYTFFFWLPLIINDIVHDSGEAAYRSSVYDIGSGVGGVLAGVVYDYTDTPATICMLFLISGVPTIYQLFMTGYTLTIFTICVFLAGCFLGGPLTLIIATLAKRLSSRHFSSSHTRSIAMIAAIFDGVGSIGASIGPLATGMLKTKYYSWSQVSYLLMACTLCGAMMISRQCYEETVMIKSLVCPIHNNNNDESETKNLLGENEE